MCDVTAFAVATVVVAGASAAAKHKAGTDAAKAANEHNGQVAALQINDRVLQLQDQNTVWEQDLKFAGDSLTWAENEWNRQAGTVGRAGQAIEKNTLAATGQLLVRQVEEDMATIAQGFDARRTGTQARASLAAKDRGVEGNSVDAILQDVSRQEGEALTVMAMNRSAVRRQLNREIIAADAQGDQQLANIAVKTFSPQTQIRSPAALPSIAPAQRVQGPSGAMLAADLAGAVIGGVQGYSAMNGQTVKDTFDRWAGKPPTIPTAGSTGRS